MPLLHVETFVVGPFQTNCYVVWSGQGEGAWIIDPGPMAKAAIRFIEDHRLCLEKIIITHGHWDHCGGAGAVKKRWPDVPIVIHSVDAPALPDPTVNLSIGSFGKLIKSPPADELLNDGDTLTLAGLTFDVIHTPGHTPGGICLHCEKEKIIFCGDLIFEGGGVGRTDLPRGSDEQLRQSVRRVLEKISPDTIIYTGHGPATRADRERQLLLGLG